MTTRPSHEEPERRSEESLAGHETGLATLLFTDLVESTALKQQWGDRAAASLIQRCHELIRQTLKEFPEAPSIWRTPKFTPN